MAEETPNNNQSAPQADNATAGTGVLALAPELGPNGLPIHPPSGEEGESVDANFLMDTFFGEGTAPPPENSAEGQAKGPNSADGGTQEGSLAPPQSAPAANAGEGSPQSGPSSEQQPGQKQVGGEGAAAQTPGQGQAQPSPEPQPAAPQLSVEDRLRLASATALEEQNRQLIERLRAVEGGQQQPQGQGQQQPSGQQPAGGEEPALRLVVPDPLYDAVMSEDPATSKQAMSMLITAVAQNAVAHTLQRVVPLIDQRMAAVTQAIEGSKQVGDMEKAYFERFPVHNNELFRSLIQSVVAEKYKAFPHAKWDEVMMDAVGATVNERLAKLNIDPSTVSSNGGAQPQGQQQQQGGNGSGQRPKPAPMLDGSTRTGNKVPQDQGDFIRSTFG